MRYLLIACLVLLASSLPAGAGSLSDEQAYKYSEALNEAARYGRSGNYKRAFEAYERAVQYNPEATDVYFNLVTIADAMKLFEKVYVYGLGYLAVAGEGSDDGRAVQAKVNAARKQLRGLGKLTTAIEPVGAMVTIDNAYMGTAPLAEVELPVGTHKLAAVAKDFHAGSVEVKVRADETVSAALKLDEIVYHGTVVLTTKPEAGVAVYLDDKYIGATPLAEPLKVQANREHVIRLEAKGFDTWTRAVTVAPDKPTPVEAVLEAPTPAGPTDEAW
jgi:tetratricopeptide (TPR) repeat protein